MRIRDPAPEEHDAAIDLWHAAGLTRPWNDPRADRALAGPSSTVRAGNDGAAAFYARLGYERSDVVVWQRVIPVDPARPLPTTLLG